MNDIIRTLIKYISSIKNTIHNNIYMIVGCYGVLTIILVCLSTKWFFHVQLTPSFEFLLPPAWQNGGDVNHVLGTDKLGRDIFSHLLISYKTTLVLTMRSTFYVIIIGGIINYLIFFISPLRVVVMIVFRLIIAIPPILSAIIISLLFGDNINYILIIIGLSYMPRFVHNIHAEIMQEWQKTYIVADRLDGVSTGNILNRYIIPNILPTYLTEVVALFGHIILALTILTFLGFGRDIYSPDLGIMMQQMLDIFAVNSWGFLSPGIIIIITILLINLLNLGTNSILTRRVEN